MNKDEEIIKITRAIARLKMDRDDTMMKEYSEAYNYGAIILADYLKYLSRPSDTSYISGEQIP